MSIRIDQALCAGCGKCVEVCPGNLIKQGKDKRAVILQERDCWGCTSCLKECSRGAIALYLGADLGGHGETLHIKKQREHFIWEVHFPAGEVKTIKVNPKEANQY
ncbi:MAG: ferredoxin family protein [Eubacteriales bacterium]|nr:ferredoxin family protein [Eubacteriales bacterium]